jgi:hypothetical protein
LIVTNLPLLLSLQIAAPWTEGPPLPLPLANNAVAGMEVEDGTGPATGAVFTFGGLGPSKTWEGITTRSFRWDLGAEQWTEITALPGPPRLAATAQAVGAYIYVFGGYTVGADGAEATTDRVDIYDPATDRWTAGAPIPVPVDDAVSGVWRDSLIVLVSGWRDRGNMPDVQFYDPAADRWRRGTDFPGVPVFGHTGGVVGEAIVVVDGVRTAEGRPRYRLERAVWVGEVDGGPGASGDLSIAWRRLDDHPGPGVYRGAAATVGERILILGGTDNPYNYDGVGYDGVPAAPNATAWSFDVGSEVWSPFPAPLPTMDHRGLVRVGDRLVLIGGLNGERGVSRRVFLAPIGAAGAR